MDLINVALLLIGVPYSWGGNSIETGLDCSGFVCEVSRSVGLLDNRDLSAQGLYEWFLKYGSNSAIKRNSILFFGENHNNITHVAIAFNDKLMIESGGEGRIETEKGYVRIRPIKSRKDLRSAISVN